MCARYRRKGPVHLIIKEFGIENAFAELRVKWWQPQFNIPPTTLVLTLRQEPSGLTPSGMRWGLVPSWAKDLKSGPPLVNAGGETVAEKPAFRSAFKARRCLIPADGYYEWKTTGKSKRPHDIHRPHDAPFAFAGLWETWSPPEGDPVQSCTIITTAAPASIDWLHDRMPVILEPKDYDQWLDPEFKDVEALKGLIRPFPGPLDIREVSTYVNKVGNEGEECLAPPASS